MKLEHWLLLILAFLIGALGQIPRPNNQGPRYDQQSHSDVEEGNRNTPDSEKLESAGRRQNNQNSDKDPFYQFTLTDVLLTIFTLGLVVVASRQADIMKRQTALMDEIAQGETADMQASIHEASKSAMSMENIAQSMAKTIPINREMADRQKLVTELSTRAYLSISFFGAIFQDENNVFEGIAQIVNRGSTPAYGVSFATQAAILPYPTP